MSSSKRRPEIKPTGSLLGSMYSRPSSSEPASSPTDPVAVPSGHGDGASVLRVDPFLVAPNPLNPRRHLRGKVDVENLDLSDLESMRDGEGHGQIQRASVVLLDKYMSLVPKAVELGLCSSVEAVHQDILAQTPAARWVTVAGSRRGFAARKFGLELDIEVRQDLAGTLADLYRSAGNENGNRKDLSPIDWAYLVQDLLKLHKTPGAVAKELRRSPGWVTQYSSLLTLPLWVQEMVENDRISLAKARKITPLGAPVLTALSERQIDIDDALGLADEDDPDERAELLLAVVKAGPGQLAVLRQGTAVDAPGAPSATGPGGGQQPDSAAAGIEDIASTGVERPGRGSESEAKEKPAGRGRPRTMGRYSLVAAPSDIASQLLKDLGHDTAQSVAEAILASRQTASVAVP